MIETIWEIMVNLLERVQYLSYSSHEYFPYVRYTHLIDTLEFSVLLL